MTSSPALKPPERTFARRIDLTSLHLFVALCELGSIGKAAAREFIAASAVSKRLSDLELTLDTPLLYRHTRGVDLTPAGESLLHHARWVLFSLEKMQGELSEYSEGVRGHVRVHASISAVVQFLPEDLGRFIHDHLVLIVPRRHSLARRSAIAFEDPGLRPRGAGCQPLGLHGHAGRGSGLRPHHPPAHPRHRAGRHVPHDSQRPWRGRDAAACIRADAWRGRAGMRSTHQRLGRPTPEMATE